MKDEEIDDVLDMLQRHMNARLSPWEHSFVESVAEQWAEQGTLTDKQKTKLDEIAERCAREHR